MVSADHRVQRPEQDDLPHSSSGIGVRGSAPVDDAFDGRSYYAAPGIATRFATQPVTALSDEARTATAGTGTELRLVRVDGAASASLSAEPGPVWQLAAWLTIAEGARSVAIRFAEEEATGDAYAFTLRPGERLITFDKVPSYPWFRYDARGHDRPWPATTGGATGGGSSSTVTWPPCTSTISP